MRFDDFRGLSIWRVILSLSASVFWLAMGSPAVAEGDPESQAIAERIAGAIRFETVSYENPEDFHRRVEIGDYLNPDAAGWAYSHPDQIEAFRSQYYEGGGIEFGEE